MICNELYSLTTKRENHVQLTIRTNNNFSLTARHRLVLFSYWGVRHNYYIHKNRMTEVVGYM